MNRNCVWTFSGARLQKVGSKEKTPNWIFIPGGPGLGSECLFPLFSILDLPGTVWRLDLPGDGSNVSPEKKISNWPQALLEAANTFEDVIMAGHSRGGMFLQFLPELEKKIKGLVLMDAAPDKSWIEEFAAKIAHSSTPEDEEYQKSPNNETLRGFVLAGAPLMFTPEGLEKGRKSLESLPFNHQAIQWTLEHFDPIYSAKWIPQEIPTLILSGSEDLPTPLKLFSEKKEYHRSNILMREIKNAGHFPWIENPAEVAAAFKEYCLKFFS